MISIARSIWILAAAIVAAVVIVDSLLAENRQAPPAVRIDQPALIAAAVARVPATVRQRGE